MQCYNELVPPSGVTHAISSSFVSANTTNLIVAKTSVLQIFGLSQNPENENTKLILVAEEHLAGTITSIQSVKILNSKSGGEAVLISFRNAKLSLVEWDPHQYCLSTISVHFYENEAFLQCPWIADPGDSATHLTVDPNSRCAAFSFGTNSIAMIPFYQSGDDLVMEDTNSNDGNAVNGANGDTTSNLRHQTLPYAPSFVLPLTALDVGMLHPIDMAFLYEYREPTIGILYSTLERSSNLLAERKDVLVYAIYAFDLDQKTPTALLTIRALPNDLQKTIPLPLPVGGTLLIGYNELVHVDQGGKTTAIGVNEFARQSSSFSMVDRSDLAIKLEGCQLQEIGSSTRDMLMILSSGELFLLEFQLDGRSVSSINVRPVTADPRPRSLRAESSCSTYLGRDHVFIGSEVADSYLLGSLKRRSLLRRQSSRGLEQPMQTMNGYQNGDNDDSVDLDDADDDLYGNIDIKENSDTSSKRGAAWDENLILLDQLPCLAPIHSVTFGKKRKAQDAMASEKAKHAKLELALTSGKGAAGAVSFLSRGVCFETVNEDSSSPCDGVWALPNFTADNDTVVIVSGRETSPNQKGFKIMVDNDSLTVNGTDLNSSSVTAVEIGTLFGGKRIVQVLEAEIKVYDRDFSLLQTLPLVDNESLDASKAVKACILDPVVLVLKDDGSLMFFKVDEPGELDELDLPSALAQEHYTSMTLFNDTKDLFMTTRFYQQNPIGSRGQLLMGLLTTGGLFKLFSLPNINIEVFSASGMHFLPSILASGLTIPRHWKQKVTLTEIVIAELGDQGHTSLYMVVKTEADDLIIYSPFPVLDSIGTFKFRKVAVKSAGTAAGAEDDNEDEVIFSRRSSLRVLPRLGDYAVVVSVGSSPMLVIMGAAGTVQIHDVEGVALRSVSPYDGPSCQHGLALVDAKGSWYKARLPQSSILTHADWTIRRWSLGQDVSSIAYHQRTETYIVATDVAQEFQLPQDDEWHSGWQQEDTNFLPQIARSTIQLFDSQKHKVLDRYDFENGERILCAETMELELSEKSHERKELLVVGTVIAKGEDVTTRGNIYVFDIVEVVPEPSQTAFDLRFRLISKEDVKGAVTAITPIGSQGFFLAAQGQKVMVRGLKDDATILPVAFMDMRYHVQVARELPGTGLCLLGDGFSGLWLVGYSEEPYKLQLLGRDVADFEVQAASFLPDGKELSIVSSNSDATLRVFQYDPENPKSERGNKLLQRSSFHLGHMPTTMTLLPRTPTGTEIPPSQSASDDAMALDNPNPPSTPTYPLHQILLTTLSGSLALLTPLPQPTHRRLAALQNLALTHLSNDLGPPPCGLNPRAYRDVSTDGIGGVGIVDGEQVKKWLMASTVTQTSLADKVGGSVWDVRADLEGVMGAGLGCL